MIDLHAIQTRVEALIRQAGKKIADTSASPIHKKAGHYNLVTDADVAVEDFLKQELLALLPDSRFFAEEQENEALIPGLSILWTAPAISPAAAAHPAYPSR